MAEGLTFRPAANHRETVERFREIREAERALPLSEAGGDVLLDHGTRTSRCYVLLHGLTNCPQQFRALGERLFAAGANVVIPRAEYHGLHVFPKAEQVCHDFIDPLQPGQQIERVYPRLIAWMENRKD